MAQKQPIIIRSPQDVFEINKIFTKYPYDIWLSSKSGFVDGKSLLGMYVLSMGEEVRIVTEDEIDTKKLMKELKPFIAE